MTRTAGQVRAPASGSGSPLGLDVVPDAEHGGPAHAGIFDAAGGLGRSRSAVKKALKRLSCEPWPP